MRTSDTENRLVKRELEFKLTDSEVAEKSREVGRRRARIRELENELDQFKDSIKGAIADESRFISQEFKKIDTGIENREVDCLECRDFSRSLVEYVYDGFVKFTRPMTMEERQTELKLHAPSELARGRVVTEKDLPIAAANYET